MGVNEISRNRVELDMCIDGGGVGRPRDPV